MNKSRSKKLTVLFFVLAFLLVASTACSRNDEATTNAGDIRDWLFLAATVGALISTIWGILLSLKEYRLKLQAEARLADSSTAETDIRLLQLFTEILTIASGRRGEAVYSKETLDLLIQREVWTDDDFKDLDKLREKISKAAMIAQLPAAASTKAAFASIATLAKRHPVLIESAIEALESFRNENWNKELSEKYLNIINDALRK